MQDHDSSDSDNGRPHSGSSSDGNGTHLGARSMGPKRLLEVVETVYKSFNPAQVTLDTHVDRSIDELQLVNSHDDTFVRQVVYGIVRYRQFLGSIMDSFYHFNGGTALREDMNIYKIFGYLTIFRHEELGYASIKRLVDAKEPQKMVVFFRYLFDERYLTGPLRDDWLKLYDKEFVDDIVRGMTRFAPEVNQLLDSLEDKVYFTRRRGEQGQQQQPSFSGSAAPHKTGVLSAGGGAGGGTTARSVATTLQPFNLSQPRPKPLPTLERPPSAPKSRPPPQPHLGPTKDEQVIAAAKVVNRKRADARAAPFKLCCTERPSSLDTMRAEMEADLKRQLTFKPPAPKAVPVAPTAQVKLNAAAVLREDALYRRKQAEEAVALQRYEAELRDASTFKAWQAEQLANDEAERQAAVEARRHAMVAVQDAAARARAAQVASNFEAGRMLKEETAAIEASNAVEREAEVSAKQASRALVMGARAGVAMAAERLAVERRAVAEEERRKQAADAKCLMEAQLRKVAEKRDIIMQLRALEKAPRSRVALLDPTDAPDHGLLEGMPLVELKERLAVAKRRAKEEEERQRAVNLSGRQARDTMLLDKAANIQRIRQIAAVQAAQRRTGAKQATTHDAALVAARLEDSVLLLHSKLEGARSASAAGKARLAAETKKIRFEQMQNAAGTSAVEENKFRELREGARREAATRQATNLNDTMVYEATRSKSQAVQMNAVRQIIKGKADFVKEYDTLLAAGRAQAAQDLATSQRTSIGRVAAQHAHVVSHLDGHRHQ